MRAAVGLGANLDDREAAIARAVEVLREQPWARRVRVSSLYETDPVGGVEQPMFLNAVAVLDVVSQPAEDPAAGSAVSSTADSAPDSAVDSPADAAWQLLRIARQIEAQLHRVRDVRWGPRTIDVDVLAVGDLVLSDPELTVPHPRVAERAFVLVPWAEVDPDFTIPGVGTVAAALAALPPDANAAGTHKRSLY